MSDDYLTMWNGKPLDDMTRQELIDALCQCAEMLRASRLDTMRKIDVMGSVIMAYDAKPGQPVAKAGEVVTITYRRISAEHPENDRDAGLMQG